MTTPADRSRPAARDSFIHTSRREQLVQVAIATIAELGFDRASVVRIAQRAGVSRGVVAYHFTDRDDLVDAVIAEVYRLGAAELGPRVAAAATPREAVLAFVGGSVEFYAAFPRHIAALSEIFVAARRSRTRSRPARPAHEQEMTDVRVLLEAGQRAGQLRAFDAAVMAPVIRSILDAVPQRLAAGADVTGLRDEIVRTVDLATRAARR